MSDLFTNIGEAEVFSCRRRRHCPGSEVRKKYLVGGVGGSGWSKAGGWHKKDRRVIAGMLKC